MKHLSALTVTAAVTVAALVLGGNPAGTQGPVQSLAPAAAAVPPDNYTPKPGVKFNKPIGTKTQQYRLFTHINRAINSAPPRSAIRIAVFSFSDMRTADNLIAAHRRGVKVKLVFDGHRMFDAQRKLRRVLGSNPANRSFAVFCEKSCRSTGGEMHGKVYQFSRSGEARRITMVGSNNMTSHNAERQWSDLLTVAGDPDIFMTFRRWFSQLKRDRPVDEPRMATASRKRLALILPNTSEADGDPAMRALQPVYCEVAGVERRTRVFISAHAWFGPRGHMIGRRVAQLADEGCLVKVFHAEDGLGSQIKEMLEATSARLQTSRHRGVRTHQKLLVVQGGYGGNPDAHFAWTGSHNWTPWAMTLDDVILRTGRLAEVKRYARHFSWMFRNA